MKTCSVENCGRPHHSRSYCTKHYQRFQRNGFVGAESVRNAPGVTFLARVQQAEGDGDCLEWVGHRNAEGYGKINFGAAGNYSAHRYAWEQVNGPIPDGRHIDHICRNRACVNVEHLRLVTPKQNLEHTLLYASNSSGYRGVSWSSSAQKWRVTAVHFGKQHYGGKFDDAEEANVAAIELRNSLYTHNNLDRV